MDRRRVIEIEGLPVSEYGQPQQPWMPSHPPPAFTPPGPYANYAAAPVRPAPSGSSKTFVLLLLVIACLALGAVLAWGLKQRGERARLMERNRQVENAYTVVLAKRNDVASFLTDRRTRLFRLEPRGAARGASLTVAWQDENRSGLVIGDSLPTPPDGAGYVVWLLPAGGGAPVRCEGRVGGSGWFRPEPGVTCFEFQAPGFEGKVEGFLVTQETRKDATSPGREVVFEGGNSA